MNDVDNYDNLSPNLQISSQRRYWWPEKITDIFTSSSTGSNGDHWVRKRGKLSSLNWRYQDITDCYQFGVLHTTIVFWSALCFICQRFALDFPKRQKNPANNAWFSLDLCPMQFSAGYIWWRYWTWTTETGGDIKILSHFSEVQQVWLRGPAPATDDGKEKYSD